MDEKLKRADFLHKLRNVNYKIRRKNVKENLENNSDYEDFEIDPNNERTLQNIWDGEPPIDPQNIKKFKKEENNHNNLEDSSDEKFGNTFNNYDEINFEEIVDEDFEDTFFDCIDENLINPKLFVDDDQDLDKSLDELSKLCFSSDSEDDEDEDEVSTEKPCEDEENSFDKDAPITRDVRK